MFADSELTKTPTRPSRGLLGDFSINNCAAVAPKNLIPSRSPEERPSHLIVHGPRKFPDMLHTLAPQRLPSLASPFHPSSFPCKKGLEQRKQFAQGPVLYWNPKLELTGTSEP
jgi:hypothetical protein